MIAFVTGGTGFVGAHMVRALLRDGARVRVLVREGSDRSNLDGLDVEVVYGDLREQERLSPLLKGCDELYHVAAFYSTRAEDGPTMFEINVRGTKNLLMAALESGMQRVVHTSTIGTIGRPAGGGLPTEETAFNLWETCSDYVKSKYLGEMVALSMVSYGLPVIVVHPCAPVGTHDIKPTSTGQRILDYMRGKRPSFPPGGINFIAVQDVAQGHLLAAHKGRTGQHYILGNAQGNLTLEGFCALMAQVSGVRFPAEAQGAPLTRLKKAVGAIHESPLHSVVREERGRQPAALICDPSKAIRELGLPQTPLEIALAEAVRWFRDHGYLSKAQAVKG